MATIVTRAGKGSPLTHNEVDANFNNLNSDKVESSALGTAAYTDSTAYATAAQGALADSATQPSDLATVATSGSYSDLIGLPSLGTAAYTDSTAYAAASHTHTLSDITDAGTAAAADTTDFDAAGTALALAIALG